MHAILNIYRKKECKIDFDKVLNEFICRILEDRKTELAIHGAGQGDIDALRGIITAPNGL